MEPVQRAPEYVVLHDSLGGMFAKGDMVPSGTYDDEQLARLVGLGAIEAVDPAGEDFEDKVEPSVELTGEDGDAGTARLPDSPAAAAPQSAEEFKERQDAAALAAAAGDGNVLTGADLTDEQRANLAMAGYRTADDVRAAPDDELLAVEGIGPAAVKRLREATRE